MRRSLARVKGFGFIFWHARHLLYHVLLGLAWAWFLREWWHIFNSKWIIISVFGSLLPDTEHLLYFFTYGRKDAYTRNLRKFLWEHEWRVATLCVEKGHKNKTRLRFHNIYIIGLLLLLASLCFISDRNSWVVLFGAMVIHYTFDIFDDIITLGYINPNWKRWGLNKQ
jgi:hypothetical protein